MNDENKLHWLVRPSTIRKLWIGSSILLALTVLAQTVIYVKGYFGFDAWFGFGAVYGFVSCLVMVLVAKLLGLVLKRPQDYYDESENAQIPDSSHDKVKESSNGV
ncbi:hypothetical protein [Paraglaciecola sp. MB-3u-78]|jgi:uncharacterized membrane protein YcjF (UPF0283 family)|uniref:hypothetical protein n=1 Tax=Paraglaciecola sp. MB-3u-78 TaxID=2058332 RepID=UPI0018E2C135|nr:hypothetical protein [Paraglaciecola sp. MB-3u-78]